MIELHNNERHIIGKIGAYPDLEYSSQEDNDSYCVQVDLEFRVDEILLNKNEAIEIAKDILKSYNIINIV